MSPSQAKAVIGDPETVRVAGNEMVYAYEHGGSLVFEADKLVGWAEPR
jgi:hypothetical protein